ncbi:hypothetical protein KAS41_01280 [Candidatus Parcubacteria bacterium]|nr:hypothetical protein [Candidatus Parcubacteria bacterium]
MDNLFLLLFLVSVITLIVGLIKPDIFVRFLKERATRKGTAIIFGISALAFFILFGITIESTPQMPQVAQENKIFENIETDKQTVKTNDEQEKKEATNKNEIIEKPNTQKEEIANKETATAPIKKESAAQATAQAQQTDRENMLTILKANASSKWGTNYEMVQYEYNNQAGAYEWIMSQTEYSNIMTSAKQKWGDDYEMVKYEYNNQVEAYNNL